MGHARHKVFEMPQAGEDVAEAYLDLLARLDRMAAGLDSAFRIPGTRVRFGWDAVIGLIPIAGDVATLAASLHLVALARRLGADAALIRRMVGNVLIDVVFGAVPVAGTVFDVLYRANLRNLCLLTEEIQRRRGAPAR